MRQEAAESDDEFKLWERVLEAAGSWANEHPEAYGLAWLADLPHARAIVRAEGPSPLEQL
jgi:hypothetical protein